jgi:uncharacterized protein (DUF924 family)
MSLWVRSASHRERLKFAKAKRSKPKVSSNVSPEDVIGFWLAAGPDHWFTEDDAFDQEIRIRFANIHANAAAGLLGNWENTPEGALALVIVLDQFSRNMFRGSVRAYAADPLARAVASRAIARGFDQQVEMPVRPFFYLPFEHSESATDQDFCLELMAATGDAESVEWARLHAGIIRRFGRFPHRNAVLGRATTPEEQTFLDSGGFSG